MKFCTHCGNTVILQIPEGDDRERFVCSSCELIHYSNPRVIVGCVPMYEGRVLLCRRAIEPRKNYWTLPAGFMENGETSVQGAARETWVVMLAVLVIGLSIVFRRFWCRSLCPAGAFLALLNGVRLFKRVVPHTEPARCDLGVRSAAELDCICCDRCRHAEM